MLDSTYLPIQLLYLCLWCILTTSQAQYVIAGTLKVPDDTPPNWHVNTRIHVEGTQFVGFVKQDGSFQVAGVPSGSYLVEPIHPNMLFQTARVDINSKGRIRARRVNVAQPNAVKELPYPLQLTTAGKPIYFKPREQMRTMDLLLNPNVLYILVPFLLVMVLTKLINPNDPDLQKELKQMNLQTQLPDMSELLSSTSFFGGGREKRITRRRTVDDNRVASLPEPTGVSGGPSSGVHGSGRKEKKKRI